MLPSKHRVELFWHVVISVSHFVFAQRYNKVRISLKKQEWVNWKKWSILHLIWERSSKQIKRSKNRYEHVGVNALQLKQRENAEYYSPFHWHLRDAGLEPRTNIWSLIIQSLPDRSIPSSKNSHLQNQSTCKTFLVKISFIWVRLTASPLASLWNRGLSQLGNDLLLCWSVYRIARKLPTYPSPKPSFCLTWELSVSVRLGEG